MNGKRYSKQDEWRHKLLLFVTGLILFETLTGLIIYFLPFGITNQINVLTHTIAGLILVIPFAWYQVRHWNIYRAMRMNYFKLTGYIMMVIMIVLIVTGIVLTYQATFSTRIDKMWSLVHIVSTFALIAFIIPHIVFIMIRDKQARFTEAMTVVLKAQRKFTTGSFTMVLVLFAIVALWTYGYEPIRLANNFPEGYSYVYGEDRPFAPSLATTESGGAFDPRSLAGSQSCGTTKCHEEIVKEWEVSAHRYSAMDVGFQSVQAVMGEQNGPESTRYCGGCHDPISLFSGNKTVYTAEDDLTNERGYQEGISCISCHSIKKTDIKGNANYTMSQPGRYMYEMKDGKTAKFISDFLIRSYPAYHVESFQHKMFKSPEFCAACHKQFIDEEVNNVGWVQLQNQYDNWRKSHWNEPGDPTKTVECRECHMPLVESNEPASGDDLDYNRTPDDGKHRSHRFLAANQFMPLALDLPGAEEHVALTEKWLRGEIEIPEIADKWEKGPAVPLELNLPDQIQQGEIINIEVIITNNKVGHDFPTGPLDIIQAWVDLEVKDQAGNIVFSSGKTDENQFIEPGSFIFKVEPVDQYGNLIDKHNLWEMVGVRYKRAMFPGFSDKAEYAFVCPSSVMTLEDSLNNKSNFEVPAPASNVTELHVTAKLKYRKFDQYMLNFLYGEDSGLTAPITVVSEDSKVVKVFPKS